MFGEEPAFVYRFIRLLPPYILYGRNYFDVKKKDFLPTKHFLPTKQNVAVAPLLIY